MIITSLPTEMTSDLSTSASQSSLTADLIGKVKELRYEAWQLLSEEAPYDRATALWNANKMCMLSSCSRGGTSVTSELLQWQGSDYNGSNYRLLSMPGEEKPHLILAGLAFPTTIAKSDDLSELDATYSGVSQLMADMSTEFGNPVPHCTNLGFYAVQLYRRLLMQWPQDLVKIDLDCAIRRLQNNLGLSFPHGYRDSPTARRMVLDSCIQCFPFIRKSFYDCCAVRSEADRKLLAGNLWSIEETPFILPPPWRIPSKLDLKRAYLLLRDPSNAFRIPFWRAVFPNSEVKIIHLVRDARESIQGLCDGWRYPFGFQTLFNEKDVIILNYSDSANTYNNGWRLSRLNFSIDQTLETMLTEERAGMTLVEVCAHQWRAAHTSIISASSKLLIPRTVINFADLRDHPEATFNYICEGLQIKTSHSGSVFARAFNHRQIMSSSIGKSGNCRRWTNSQFSGEISSDIITRYLSNTSHRLGLGKLAKSTTKTTYIHSRSHIASLAA